MRAIREHLQDHTQVDRFIDDADDPGRNGITRIIIK
jgi:hypothetical protein